MSQELDKSDKRIWYNKKTRVVHGTGNINLIEKDGQVIVDSPDWDSENHVFIRNFTGSVEGDGPWYYHDGGVLRTAPPRH